MRTINRTIVSAHLWSSDGKIFMALDDGTSGVYPNTWKIPGGGIEEGEGMTEGVIREVKEEVGLDISQYPIEPLSHILYGETEKVLKDTGEKVLAKMEFHTFKVQLDTLAEDIAIHLDQREFVEYRWFTIAELKEVKLSPPSVELFTKLRFL
jgi:8-oxo-dGTP pyrophosphatase MutT (NUDIX family)